MSNKVQPLSAILRGICKQLGLQKEMALYQIQAHWEEIVGPQIALHTLPDQIHFHTLSLKVDSAPWVNQLLFFKKEIVEKTNQFLKLREGQESVLKDVYLKMAPLHSFASNKVLSEPHLAPNWQSDVDSKWTHKRGKERSKEIAPLHEEINTFQDETLKKTVREALSGYFQGEPTGLRFQKKSRFVGK